MAKIKGFSLVELMISLIIISIITAAFTPILTKKLKTSDQSIGTATAVSIVSNTICNSVSEGCMECEKDKCLAVDENSGYFLNQNTGKTESCSSAMTGCSTCTDNSHCTKAQDGYYLSGETIAKCNSECKTCEESAEKCTSCISDKYYKTANGCSLCSFAISNCNTCSSATKCTSCNNGFFVSGSVCAKCSSALNHCNTCSDSNTCIECDNGYFKTDNNVCWKYECADKLCTLTRDNNTIMSMYRYYLGDGGFTIPAGITVCKIGSASCTGSSTNPMCWNASYSDNLYTGDASKCSRSYWDSVYSGCDRTVCNLYAARKAQSNTWVLPNLSQALDIIQIHKHISWASQLCYMTEDPEKDMAVCGRAGMGAHPTFADRSYAALVWFEAGAANAAWIEPTSPNSIGFSILGSSYSFTRSRAHGVIFVKK